MACDWEGNRSEVPGELDLFIDRSVKPPTIDNIFTFNYSYALLLRIDIFKGLILIGF